MYILIDYLINRAMPEKETRRVIKKERNKQTKRKEGKLFAFSSTSLSLFLLCFDSN